MGVFVGRSPQALPSSKAPRWPSERGFRASLAVFVTKNRQQRTPKPSPGELCSPGEGNATRVVPSFSRIETPFCSVTLCRMRLLFFVLGDLPPRWVLVRVIKYYFGFCVSDTGVPAWVGERARRLRNQRRAWRHATSRRQLDSSPTSDDAT